MSDIESLNRFLAILRSLPLWILGALAAAGYAALFAPSFGDVDLQSFRHQWGACFWLDASTFTALTVFCAGDAITRVVYASRKVSKRRKRSLDSQRYYHIYVPLFAKTSKIFITSDSIPIKLRRRLEISLDKLCNTKRPVSAVKAAWKALFDRQFGDEIGDVEYGDGFPINDLRRIVHGSTAIALADDKLLDLVRRAESERMDSQIGSERLSQEDVYLVRHIESEYSRLKKLVLVG